jgi:crooked neck
MEEMCRETAKARAVFDRWMAFEPDHAAWMAYIKVRWGAQGALRHGAQSVHAGQSRLPRRQLN